MWVLRFGFWHGFPFLLLSAFGPLPRSYTLLHPVSSPVRQFASPPVSFCIVLHCPLADADSFNPWSANSIDFAGMRLPLNSSFLHPCRFRRHSRRAPRCC